MLVALAAVLALAMLPAHSPTPWLPTSLALLALVLVGIAGLMALNLLTQTVQRGLQTQSRTLEALLAAPAQALAAQSADLATQAGRLAQQGETWRQAVQDLQAAQRGFISEQSAAEERHEEQVRQLFAGYQEALASFAEEAKHQQSEARAEAQQFTLDLQTRQTELLNALLEQLRAQIITLQRDQADTIQRLVEGLLAQSAETFEQRVSGIESQFGGALQMLRAELPPALHSGIQTALAGAVELVDLVREQAGTLAHTVAQVGQNADRQVQAYNQWANRVADWQLRLDQTLTDAQAAQAEMQTGWQLRADQSLGRIDQTLSQAAETSRRGHESMAQATTHFAQNVINLEVPVKTLQDQLNALLPPLAALNSTAALIATPAASMSVALEGLNGATNNLTRALTLSAMSEQNRIEQAEKTTVAFTQSMSTSLQRLNETIQVLNMTLQALQNAADSSRQR